jgi:hypothetical protein
MRLLFSKDRAKKHERSGGSLRNGLKAGFRLMVQPVVCNERGGSLVLSFGHGTALFA